MQNLQETIQSPKFPLPKVIEDANGENSLGKIIEQLPPKSSLILHLSVSKGCDAVNHVTENESNQQRPDLA